MKKFTFSLDKVLDYKTQVEQNLINEHSQIVQKIKKVEGHIEHLETEFSDVSLSLQEQKEKGCLVQSFYLYEGYLSNIETNIKREKNELKNLVVTEELKRKEVIQAKTETTSIDKLKEKRITAYQHEVRKAEELFIEEFVASKRAVAIHRRG